MIAAFAEAMRPMTAGSSATVPACSIVASPLSYEQASATIPLLSITGIVQRASDVEVLGIEATRYIAVMQHMQPVRYRANQQLVGQSMHIGTAVVDANAAIWQGRWLEHGPGPQPAVGVGVDLTFPKESNEGRFGEELAGHGISDNFAGQRALQSSGVMAGAVSAVPGFSLAGV